MVQVPTVQECTLYKLLLYTYLDTESPFCVYTILMSCCTFPHSASQTCHCTFIIEIVFSFIHSLLYDNDNTILNIGATLASIILLLPRNGVFTHKVELFQLFYKIATACEQSCNCSRCICNEQLVKFNNLSSVIRIKDYYLIIGRNNDYLVQYEFR